MNNKGFSLIELLVTIAVSSIVLLMISFMLVQGTNLFKGENENIDMQNEIQIVRNQISEAIMGAKSIAIVRAGEDLVIYTGSVDGNNNCLVAESSGAGGTSEVTTERIITYDKSEQKLYISSAYGFAIAEGNLLSEWVADMDISIDEKCKRVTGAGEHEEEYYVNPLSINISMTLAYGDEESDVDISVKARNILSEVVQYTTDGRETLLINATSESLYRVK